MDIKIKNKIKSIAIFITIIICGLFIFGLNNIKAQDYEWNQANTNGFDNDINNEDLNGLVTFNGYLYAGTQNTVTGGQIWRSSDGSTWSEVIGDGFGDAINSKITSLSVFGSYLYAGTKHGGGIEIWRSVNGIDWSPIAATGEVGAFYTNGFGDNFNEDVLSMEVYNSYLYIGIQNVKTGGEVWRTSNGTVWSQINADGFGVFTGYAHSLKSFDGKLYAATGDPRAEIWNCTTCDGGDWDYVVGDGPPARGGGASFGSALIKNLTKLVNFGSYLYTGTQNSISGGEIRRSLDGSSWEVAVGSGATIGKGFGDVNNSNMNAAASFNNQLYFGTTNLNGAEIWSSGNGTSWTQSNTDGFSDANNDRIQILNEFNSHLYAGTYNTTDGGELWQLNYIPEGSALTAAQSDDGDGKVTISFAISDEENDNTYAQIQYNVGSGWQDPTISTNDSETTATFGDPSVDNSASYQIRNITTPAASNTVTTVWNSQTDESSTDVATAQIRIRFNDGISTSDWIETTLDLDNVPPNPPTLNPVTSPTNIDTQTIAGGKDANTSVLLSDTEIVSLNASAAWSYDMDLLEGVNSISLTSKDDKGNESTATTGSITLDTTAPNTEADPPGGTYIGILDEVTLSSDEAGTTIYYTNDGTDPNLDSDIYSDPLEISNNTTLKFFGVDSLGNQEAINEEVYVFIDASVRLTKSVSIESAEAAAYPFEFKYSGLIRPTIGSGLNNLKSVIYRAANFIKYPDFNSYHKIAQIILILLCVSTCIVIFVVSLRKIKNKNLNNNYLKIFKLAFVFNKKLFFSLVIFVSIFAISESIIAIHMLSAADAEVERGDVLIYQINYQNISGDDVRDFYFVDSIPLFTEYISESMEMNDVVVTDAADIDQADYNITWPGHTYYRIGNLSVGATGSITFKVKVSDIASDGAIVSNRAVGGYNPGAIRVESNTVSNSVKVETIDEGGTTSGSRGGSSDEIAEGTGEDDGDNDLTAETSDNDSFTNRNGNKVDNDVQSAERIIEEVSKPSLWDNLVNINKFALAPILVLLALLNLFSTFSLGNIIPFLRYIWQVFTEPLLYFGEDKRKGWGVVYDSQTKKPIDLALVRLYNKKTKKLIETKVTDFEGRYIFIIEGGAEYYLEVLKPGYTFPSRILASIQSDKNYDHIYHGEIISIDHSIDAKKKEQGYIAYNVPLDIKEGVVYSNEVPHKPIKTSIRNIKELDGASDARLLKDNKNIFGAIRNFKIHIVLACIGPLLGLISFIFAPSWITSVLFLLHLAMLFFFIVLARKKDEKPFGRVYNKDNNNSLSKSVVRLFDSKYGRLLSTTVSKSDGRYGFLAGDNKYLLNSTKEGFVFPEGKIEIMGEKQGIIKKNLGMKEEQ